MTTKPKQTILKKTLLELVLIRAKIKKVDTNGMWYCITCNHYWHWITMCWGHFIPQAKGNSCKFEIDWVNLQCNNCNWRANQWEQYKHWLYIDKEFGTGRAEQLHQQSRSIRKWKVYELEEQIDLLQSYIIAWYIQQDKKQQDILVAYMKKNSERKRKCRSVLETITPKKIQ